MGSAPQVAGRRVLIQGQDAVRSRQFAVHGRRAVLSVGGVLELHNTKHRVARDTRHACTSESDEAHAFVGRVNGQGKVEKGKDKGNNYVPSGQSEKNWRGLAETVS